MRSVSRNEGKKKTWKDEGGGDGAMDEGKRDRKGNEEMEVVKENGEMVENMKE